MLKQIMKRAHEIAKKLVGDYAARLKYALKKAWAEYKASKKGDINMVELKGTEKQVKWAKDIKKCVENVIDHLEKNFSKVEFKKERKAEKCKIQLDNLKKEVENQENAKFFIDFFKGVNAENTVLENAQVIKFGADDMANKGYKVASLVLLIDKITRL